MTLAEFHDALSILNSIELEELERVGINTSENLLWDEWPDNPGRTFASMCESERAKVWSIVEARIVRAEYL